MKRSGQGAGELLLQLARSDVCVSLRCWEPIDPVRQRFGGECIKSAPVQSAGLRVGKRHYRPWDGQDYDFGVRQQPEWPGHIQQDDLGRPNVLRCRRLNAHASLPHRVEGEVVEGVAADTGLIALVLNAVDASLVQHDRAVEPRSVRKPPPLVEHRNIATRCEELAVGLKAVCNRKRTI